MEEDSILIASYLLRYKDVIIMLLVYYDGRTLRCNSLYFTEKEVIADGVHVIPLIEVLRVEQK